MSLTLNHPHKAVRLTILLITSLACLWLSWLVLADFIIGTFTEDGSLVSRATLTSAYQYFPHSPRIAARLAAAAIADAGEDEQVTGQAAEAAARAVQLSPQNAHHHVLAALAKGLQGDAMAAENHLKVATVRAPNDRQIRWRLANQLVRTDNVYASLEHFRYAVANNPVWLPQSLDLLWQVTQGDCAKLEVVAGDAPQARLMLAQFYLEQSQPQSAVAALATVDRNALLALPDTPSFFDALLQAGDLPLARQHWSSLLGGQVGGQVGGLKEQAPLIWNGSFETTAPQRLAHFDWKLTDSRFVAVQLDDQVAHTGQRSLRLQFLGRDPTQLSDEVQQIILLRPGARYRLECFIQTKQLVIREGLRIVLLNQANSLPLASSAPIVTTPSGWQRLAFEFATPANATTAKLILQRTPKFIYEEAAKGLLWLDDISLTQL